MRKSNLPPEWYEERVQKVLARYEAQSEDEALAEDEAAFEAPGETVMAVRVGLVPAGRALIAKHSRRGRR